MTRYLRMPPRGRSGAWLFALGIALVLAVQPIWPDRTAVAVTGGIALTLVVAARWQLRWLPVVVLVLCGIALRLSVITQEASDVSDVTSVAIGTMLNGGNPYGVGYIVSRPTGAPFPYGPVALLWYLPWYRDPALIEFFVSTALMLFATVLSTYKPWGRVRRTGPSAAVRPAPDGPSAPGGTRTGTAVSARSA